jgi:DNA topoisomerase-1
MARLKKLARDAKESVEEAPVTSIGAARKRAPTPVAEPSDAASAAASGKTGAVIRTRPVTGTRKVVRKARRPVVRVARGDTADVATETTGRVAKKGRRITSITSRGKGGRRSRAGSTVDVLPPPPPGTTALVIVESPAKAKTIGKYLGRGFRVKATVGHVRDLPTKTLGVDVDHGFKPEYVTIAGKEKTLADLREAAHSSREVYLATDPDREGEAIAWHVAGQINRRGSLAVPIRRALFHEITKDAVQEAIASAGEIDERKVNAQQARRVLDRLVGYKASPVLWKTVKKGVSAGRVQTVALRLLVEREREIRAFKPVEYWTIGAELEKNGQRFETRLHQIAGEKPEIGTEAEATRIVNEVRAAAAELRRSMNGNFAGVDGDIGVFGVTDLKQRERRKNPQAPFTTSTLQQEAAKKLGFGSKRTMRLAQDLYEGVDVGPDGAVGLITYMRTDSSRVSEAAAQHAREHLYTLFGEEYLSETPMLFGDNKKNAQDAHEAVRPTDPARRPEHVQQYLTADQFKLYQLIWQRFMASQMAPAVFDTTTVDFELGSYLFRASGSVMKFEGFLAIYREGW